MKEIENLEKRINDQYKIIEAKIEAKKSANKPHSAGIRRLKELDEMVRVLEIVKKSANQEWWSQFYTITDAPFYIPGGLPFGEGISLLWGKTEGETGENNRWAK